MKRAIRITLLPSLRISNRVEASILLCFADSIRVAYLSSYHFYIAKNYTFRDEICPRNRDTRDIKNKEIYICC